MAKDRAATAPTGVSSLLRRVGLLSAAASAAALLVAPGAGAVNVSYTFDAGDQGWRVAQTNGGPFAPPDFNPSGGNPNGYISARDTGADTGCNTPGTTAPCDLFYFTSPGISGALAANYGGAISFDFATNTPAGFAGVVYVDTPAAGGYELVRMWQAPSVGFQPIVVPLTESGWLYCGGTPYACSNATQPQFQSVLAAATFTDVLADVVNGTGETYALDNFAITEPPATPAKKCKRKKAKGKKGSAAAKKKCKKKKRKKAKGKKSAPSAPLLRLSR
jgi:hypothetical protein